MTGPLVPPHDVEAERVVVAYVVCSAGRDYGEVRDLVSPGDFYVEANRQILEAVESLIEHGKPADFPTIADWLKARGKLDAVGGPKALIELELGLAYAGHVRDHAERVAGYALQRRVIHECQRVAAEGYGSTDPRAFAESAESRVFEAASRSRQSGGLEPVSALVSQVDDQVRVAGENQGRLGFTWGLKELDQRTGGLCPGDLTIVAGRPGMGKTAFVLQAIASAAAAGIRNPSEHVPCVAPFFSLEMPKVQLTTRLIAAEAKLCLSDLRKGVIRDQSAYRRAQNHIHGLPILIDDTAAASLAHIRAQVRRAKARIDRGDFPARELGPIAVDYIQLMGSTGSSQSREQEVSLFSRGLKQLAKDFNVPVVALSQLNRSVETRSAKDKRPQLSDLRESGAIEQDADVIVFIYRDDYYFQDSEDKGLAEIIIAKQRNGPTGKVFSKFTGEYTRFDDLAPDGYEFDEFDNEFDDGAHMGAPLVGGEPWH